MKFIDNLILQLEKLYIFLFLVRSSKDKTKIDLKKSYTKNLYIVPFYFVIMGLFNTFIKIPFLNIIVVLIFGIFIYCWIFALIGLKPQIDKIKKNEQKREK